MLNWASISTAAIKTTSLIKPFSSSWTGVLRNGAFKTIPPKMFYLKPFYVISGKTFFGRD
jgi:hypothetical protein